MKPIKTIHACAFAVLGLFSMAQSASAASHAGAPSVSMDHSKMDHGTASTATPQDDSEVLTSGVVRKVDPEQGKLTIKHEPITNLDMPSMTMVFKASKPELLTGLKPGDKIRFRAETVSGGLAVTRVEKAN